MCVIKYRNGKTKKLKCCNCLLWDDKKLICKVNK